MHVLALCLVIFCCDDDDDDDDDSAVCYVYFRGFVDDVMFSHNGANTETGRWRE